jgi:hypothetical protein
MSDKVREILRKVRNDEYEVGRCITEGELHAFDGVGSGMLELLLVLLLPMSFEPLSLPGTFEH